MEDNLLDIKKLSVHYFNKGNITKAVENVDLSIQKGETVGLVGESGCGKSSLALAILRLIDPPGKIYGEIKWKGRNLLNLSSSEMREMRGGDISMVFQDPFSALNPVFNVGEQIAEVFRVHQGLSRKEAWDNAVRLLGLVHIADPEQRANDYPHQFSGGMKQRVAVAMAYALSPDLLIADEPTTALDVTMQKSILELLKELKTTILFISHNIALVSELCGRICVMQDGRIVEEGRTVDIINDPKDAYTAKLVNSFREINLDINRS
jgi:peptide/nickel transport system ATP-binding protein/oligopeptide transport system ATP-binding protein